MARLTQDFSRCVGIEILSALHNQATVIVDRYNSSFKPYLYVGSDSDVSVHEVRPTNLSASSQRCSH